LSPFWVCRLIYGMRRCEMTVPIPEFTKDAPCSNIHEPGEE